MDSELVGSQWWKRLNRALFPYMGPAQIGPRAEEPLPATIAAMPCPLCGAPMTAHTVERPGGNVASRVRCPAPEA